MFSSSFNLLIQWITLSVSILAIVSGQDADFLNRIRAHSRNAQLSVRLEKAFALKRGGPEPQERKRPDPNVPDYEGLGPDAGIPAIGRPPGSPGPDIFGGQGIPSTTTTISPDWGIAFPGQPTTETAGSFGATPGLLPRNKNNNRSKNTGNSQETLTTTEGVIDPWAKIFGSKVETTTPDFQLTTIASGFLPSQTPPVLNWKTIRGSQTPPTDNVATTTDSWEIATDAGFGGPETTTEPFFGARAKLETTVPPFNGFGAQIETTTELFGFGGGRETTLAPFNGFGAGFETTTPATFVTDPFPGNFEAKTTAPAPEPLPQGPIIPVSNGNNNGNGAQNNKGPPPVEGLTRKMCEDNAKTAAKYGINDIIVWVDSNCALARTVFKGRSCEDFSKSARWCYA